jgi:hypothetical protein
MAAKADIAGTAGAIPPPGAPHEISQPLQPDAGAIVYADGTRMTPAERARQNERELAPLKPAGDPLPQAEAPPALDPFYQRLQAQGPPAGPTVIKRIKHLTPRPAVPRGEGVAHAEEALGVAPSDSPSPVDVPPLTPEDLARMPAASNTDSPSRGIPTSHTTQSGLPIDAGLGLGGMDYYALTGAELFTLVETLMDQLHARCQNDLRFNEAITYPQVSVRVAIEIHGFAQDQAQIIDVVLPPEHPARATNPLALAHQVADEIAFVLVESRAETTPEGEPATPPDAIRDELGLTKPRKQIVTGPGGSRSFVDIRS